MTPGRLVKTLLGATVALSLALGALFLSHRPRHPNTPFAEFVDRAEKMSLQTGPARIDLIKNGTDWLVSAPSIAGVYRAEIDRVHTLLSDLKSVKVEDVISESGKGADEFEINPGSATQVTLYGPQGARLAEGVFGKQSPDSPHIYFKFSDRPQIYLAHGLMRGNLGIGELRGWRDHTLLNVAEDNILTLFIQAPGYTTALARSSDTWTCNGKLVDPAHVWGMLGILAHLKADDFVDPVKRPDLTPAKLTTASIAVQLRDRSTHALRIGKLHTQTKLIPIAVDKDPTVFWVNEYTLKAVLQKPSDFAPKK